MSSGLSSCGKLLWLPRLTELYLVNCLGEPRQSALVRGALRSLLQPPLDRFVARLTRHEIDERFSELRRMTTLAELPSV